MRMGKQLPQAYDSLLSPTRAYQPPVPQGESRQPVSDRWTPPASLFNTGFPVLHGETFLPVTTPPSRNRSWSIDDFPSDPNQRKKKKMRIKEMLLKSFLAAAMVSPTYSAIVVRMGPPVQPYKLHQTNLVAASYQLAHCH